MKNIKVLLNKIAGATLKTKILAGAVAVAITVVPVTAVVAYNNHQEEVRLAQELEARELAEKVEKERKEKEEEEKKKAEEEAKLKAEEEAKAQEEEAQAQEEATQDSNNTVANNNKPNSDSSNTGNTNTGNNNGGAVAPTPQPPKPTKPSGWDAEESVAAYNRMIRPGSGNRYQAFTNAANGISERLVNGQISIGQAEAEYKALGLTIIEERDGVEWWLEPHTIGYETYRVKKGETPYRGGGSYAYVKAYYHSETDEYTYHVVTMLLNSAWQ